MKILLLLSLLMNIAIADEFDEFETTSSEDSKSSGLVFNGFIEVEQGARTSTEGPHKDDNYVLANRRLRVQTSKTFDDGGFFFKFDFLNDDVLKKSFVDARELRVQYKLSKNVDISVGRQVSTWGVADMLFINDLFPKNWLANFQGRDMEMLKEPSNSVRVTSYISKFIWDIVYQPEFSPDVTPNGCTFSVFNPNANDIVASDSVCGSSNYNNLDDKTKNRGELAMSLKTNIGNQEVALYGYNGFYKAPKAVEYDGTTFTQYHSGLNVLGLSSEGQVGSGILTFETGYYNSQDDQSGENYFVPNSKLKYLIGYKQDLTSKFSYGVQAYQEKMMNYDSYEKSFLSYNSAGYDYRHKEIQSTFTLRLTYKLQQETLWLSLFNYTRPDDKDSFTKIEASKKLTDNFKITAGYNHFEGDDNYSSREFGMLKDDDNVFIRFNYLY